MGLLTDAVEASEARKAALFGEADSASVEIPDAFQKRAIWSGFDIDQDELDEMAERAGLYMARLAANSDMPLHKVFSTCWVDALLLGMLVNSLQKNRDIDADG